ncbi:hypothetical protein H257_02439 [Aphanomyces astaci]|uniref:Chromo domain-containing protein n=1 Tax=Aphanomyces astaci TaxID=112090 RepID=W4H1L1_APHAT|nr:hypothetical protein H257_02439 [Aphanomyces astaci]ETV85910.1 hypothetical protein H257_02439 [Aphanomyces astaci]|eukprot:XP_009824382.1 hypothetical protein H257_02439 [Aphanomyces astaci]
MNLIPPSVQPFCGNPTRRPSGSDLHLVEDGLLVPRGVRDLAQFYSAPHCALQGNSIEALNISKMYLELDQVKHSELYIVDPTLSETDRDARLAEIKAHTTAIQREVIAHEATKKLANQPSAAHTYVISAISTHLRRLYQATTCPYELFEHIKTRFEFNPMENNPTVVASYLRTHEFTDDGCIGTLPVERFDLVKRYRISMNPPSFNSLHPSAISSVDYHNHIWNYYTLCAMSDTIIGEKELFKVHHDLTLAYCLWRNGTVQRMNRDILQVIRVMLRDYQLDEKEWHYLLPVVQFNFNQTPTLSLANKSPMELFTALNPATPLDVVQRGRCVKGSLRSQVATLGHPEEQREAHTLRVKMYAEVEVTDEILEHVFEQGIVLKVKSIAGHKFVPDVSDFMLEVFWEGFEDIESSWEPLKKLMREWPAMVKAYVAAKKNAEDHEILTKAMKRAIVAK